MRRYYHLRNRLGGQLADQPSSKQLAESAGHSQFDKDMKKDTTSTRRKAKIILKTKNGVMTVLFRAAALRNSS